MKREKKLSLLGKTACNNIELRAFVQVTDDTGGKCAVKKALSRRFRRSDGERDSKARAREEK
jgi:hypothetical protein